MAKSPFLNRIEAAFGVVGAGALVVSYFLVTGTNPLPDLLDLVGRAGRLSQPETRWTQRVGDQPTSAVAAGGAVIVL
ncbi:MAG: hypothetical protein JXA67_03605, partial [Micromonosporaceae bacterium]|nr:hypothetical protein [Micromonosporaceae bacterium]